MTVIPKYFIKNDNCSICSEPLKKAAKVVTTECNHQFCKVCLQKWLASHSSCPSCRQKITDPRETENYFFVNYRKNPFFITKKMSVAPYSFTRCLATLKLFFQILISGRAESELNKRSIRKIKQNRFLLFFLTAMSGLTKYLAANETNTRVKTRLNAAFAISFIALLTSVDRLYQTVFNILHPNTALKVFLPENSSRASYSRRRSSRV